MSYRSPIKNYSQHRATISRLGEELQANGGEVRRAESFLPMHCDNYETGKTEIRHVKHEAIFLQGLTVAESRLFVFDRLDEKGYHEVDMTFEDMTLNVGDVLNVTAFDYQLKARLKAKGIEKPDVKESRPMEPFALGVSKLDTTALDAEAARISIRLQGMNDKYETEMPIEVRLPSEAEDPEVLAKVYAELEKLDKNLERQYALASEYDTHPVYASDAFDFTSEEYRNFKRDVIENLTFVHGKGFKVSVDNGYGGRGFVMTLTTPAGDEALKAEYRGEWLKGRPIRTHVGSTRAKVWCINPPSENKMFYSGVLAKSGPELLKSMMDKVSFAYVDKADRDAMTPQQLATYLSGFKSDGLGVSKPVVIMDEESKYAAPRNTAIMGSVVSEELSAMHESYLAHDQKSSPAMGYIKTLFTPEKQDAFAKKFPHSNTMLARAKVIEGLCVTERDPADYLVSVYNGWSEVTPNDNVKTLVVDGTVFESTLGRGRFKNGKLGFDIAADILLQDYVKDVEPDHKSDVSAEYERRMAKLEKHPKPLFSNFSGSDHQALIKYADLKISEMTKKFENYQKWGSTQRTPEQAKEMEDKARRLEYVTKDLQEHVNVYRAATERVLEYKQPEREQEMVI